MAGAATSSCATCAAATVWSAGYQPSGAEPDRYEVVFSEDRAEIIRHDGAITTTLEVAVSSEDDAEVRRVSITNHGSRAAKSRSPPTPNWCWRRRRPTIAHPAFSKLFVETEFVAGVGALLATRRRRSPTEAGGLGRASGRRRRRDRRRRAVRDRPRPLPGPRPRHPRAARDDRMAGRFPTRSARCWIRSSACAAACGSRRARPRASRSGRWSRRSRDEVLDLVDKHHEAMAFDRATTLAWTQAQVQLHHLGIDAERSEPVPAPRQSRALCRPGAAPAVRDASRAAAARSRRCGRMGISGDLPIVLVRIDDMRAISTSCGSCCSRTNIGG